MKIREEYIPQLKLLDIKSHVDLFIPEHIVNKDIITLIVKLK